NARSGTPRVVWPAFWPTPTCQLGIGSNVLGLPPVPDHTVSPCQAVVVAFSVVPPTATTYGELAGQLGVVPFGLPPHSLEPASPEDTENVWPCASACWKIASAAAAEPSPFAEVSHSPNDTLMTLAALAVTTVLKSSTMLELASVGMLYNTILPTWPPPMPTMSWLSRSHSAVPLVSVPVPPVLTICVVTVARPFCEVKVLRSESVWVRLPFEMMPTVTPAAVGKLVPP